MNKGYIASLLKPLSTKTAGRKSWGIDLETVIVPFFVATNATGDTQIEREALGCPLRLAYQKDGSVKFSDNGKPVIQIAKPITQAVRMLRENFIATLQDHAHTVATEQADLYNSEIQACMKAGKPIAEHDSVKLGEAIAEQKRQAVAHVESLVNSTDEAELVEANS
ncbi:MAG: hypothetical protein PHI12_11995 [Dehalococcoidales bacterium]|nr:hypothetical protein [Dehalococcoidales bacterium]